MRPEKREEVRGWLEKADEDLRSAKADLAFDPPIQSDALFHCQQAVEKVMKGFLTAHDRSFHKTHDLDQLAQSCRSLDPTLQGALDSCRKLTVYAWRSRYPGAWGEDLPDDPEDALALAREAYRAIQDRLPKEVHVKEIKAGTIVLPPGGVVLDDVEKELIRQALKRCGGRIKEASELLGLTHKTLQYRLKKHGIDRHPSDE
jgi:HEPN domain-containing protein